MKNINLLFILTIYFFLSGYALSKSLIIENNKRLSFDDINNITPLDLNSSELTDGDINKIIKDEKIYAIIIRSNYTSDGIEFFTPNDFSQQLAYMRRPKGYNISPHIHVNNDKTINNTQEVLIIKSGKVRVDFYDEKKNYFIQCNRQKI